jgi:hypothetical protein
MATASGAGTGVRHITPAKIITYLDSETPVEYWVDGGKINVLWDGTLISMSEAEWDQVKAGLAVPPQETDAEAVESIRRCAPRVVEALIGEAADDEGDPDFTDTPEEDGEKEFETKLRDILEGEGMRTSTFDEAGILTRNKGLVIRDGDKKYQLTIVEDRRGY